MNKIILFLLTMAISSNGVAVHISHDNTGEVLIFPYYTTNNGFNTLVNITNVTDQAKALRVRFREAANGREVYAFNAYLGPNDAWVGALLQGTFAGETLTKLISNDSSCTVPLLNGANTAADAGNFYDRNFTGDQQDEFGQASQRMFEGFVEVIEMGTLTGASAQATLIEQNNNDNCMDLVNAWDINSNNSYWVSNSNTDLLPPTGGIMGSVVLIDVQEGLAINQQATVLSDFSDEVIHFNAGNDAPSLASGKNTARIKHADENLFFQWDSGFEAVSSVLMAATISNDFALDPDISAQTDWIVTLPTKAYHLDEKYAGTLNVPVAPFIETANSVSASCQPFSVSQLFDRETSSPVPDNASMPNFCYVSNNMNFTSLDDNTVPTGIFGSHFPSVNALGDQQNLSAPFTNGWAELAFESRSMNNQTYQIEGLPVIGFSAQQYTNNNAQPGLLAQYAGLFEHKKTAVIQNSNDASNSQNAMQVADDHIGQMLIYPYYTVRNDINSLIAVVNTTDQVKALKLRFFEGTNEREALSFNLYLAPYDVWTAGLVASESTVPGFEGQASTKIFTNDTSCTVPAINGQEFLPFAFTGAFDDGLSQDMSRVTEGSFEIIEMGSVINEDAEAATHMGGVPQDCFKLIAHWIPPNGQWIIDDSTNMVDPDGSGGLYGSMSLIDSQTGIDLTYDAVAVINFSRHQSHSFPGDLFPNSASGDNATTDIETVDGFITTTWDSPAHALTALFMQAQIHNEYAIEPSINAETEWVNFFPTRSLYVDPLSSIGLVPVAPFSQALNQFGACEDHVFSSFNREQQRNPAQDLPPFDPPPPNFNALPQTCWSVNVTDINKGNNDNTLFDSRLPSIDFMQDPDNASASNVVYNNGWMRMDFVDENLQTGQLTGQGPNGETHTIYGLPVIGFVAQKYINSNAQPGLLANYGTISMNKNKRKVVISSIIGQ